MERGSGGEALRVAGRIHGRLVGINGVLCRLRPTEGGVLVQLLLGVSAGGDSQQLHGLHGVTRLDGQVALLRGLRTNLRLHQRVATDGVSDDRALEDSQVVNLHSVAIQGLLADSLDGIHEDTLNVTGREAGVARAQRASFQHSISWR